jgi:hypothetical protein
MPESTFFDPMSMGGAPFPMTGISSSRNLPPLDYQTQQNLRMKAGYTNQYGTDIGGSFTPNKGALEAHANFPIGAYEHGNNFGVSGFVRPGGPAGASDFGGMLTFGKVNRAQVGAADVLNGLSDSQKELLQSNPELLEVMRRKQLDAANQIGLPGSQKYQLNFGLDTNAQRTLTPGSQQSLQNYNESLSAGSMPVDAPGLARSGGFQGMPGVMGAGASGAFPGDPATFTRNYARDNVIPLMRGMN